MRIEVKGIGELDKAAEMILETCKHEKIFAFYGEMGSGKTTLIGRLCKLAGSGDAISSPTFAVVNEYQGKQPIFHIDAYRLNSPQEAMDIGLGEYFEQGALCFVEWASRIEYLLPEETVKISIEMTGENSRTLTIEQPWLKRKAGTPISRQA